ncbi:hypothetical protein COLO4_05745 [Corchorus olitorius]|uniref:Uncharacterized protein n=1 Tax=Corchorus olitorius TaxID=93759 RepID=A0A1R3KQ30_9ROSI|nr:hypothetical protein COLO4_05745 [Corchorus olitorius]
MDSEAYPGVTLLLKSCEDHWGKGKPTIFRCVELACGVCLDLFGANQWPPHHVVRVYDDAHDLNMQS